MGKIELFKGVLSATVTSDSFMMRDGYNFSIKLNEEIEGLPKEFLVRSKISHHFLFLRKGDNVKIGGKIFQSFEGKEQLEHIFMKTDNVYNTSLKHGAGLKIKRKEVFNGSLSGTATSDLLTFSQYIWLFSIKLDKEIEGIPNEFVVSSSNLIIIRRGDKILIEGILFHGTMGKNEYTYTEMKALNVYNRDLICGG